MAGPQGLDFQLAAVKFTQGLDTRTEKKLVIPAKWNKLNNLMLSESGSPRRRDGVTNLVSGRTGNGLAPYNNQLLAVSGPKVYSVSKALSTAPEVSGLYSNFGVAKREIQRSVGMQDSCDMAIGSSTGAAANNLACYVWREKTGGAVVTGVNVALFDESTGATIIRNTQMRTSAAVFCPRVVYCPNLMGSGGTFFIFYIQGTSLYCRTILTSSPTVLNAEVALITSASLAALNFDCCAFGTDAGGNTTAMVSYGWADGAVSLRTIQVSHAAGVPAIAAGPTNLATEANLAIANLCGICCTPISSTLAATFTLTAAGVPYAGTEGYTILASTWAIVSRANVRNNPPPVNNPCHITAVSDGSFCYIASDSRSSWGANASNLIQLIVSDTVMVLVNLASGIYSADFAGAATDPAGPRGPYIAGKIFLSGSRVYLPVETLENYQSLAATKASNNQQSTFFLCDMGTTGIDASPRMNVVAHALYGGVGVATINNNAPTVSTPCSTPSNGSGAFGYATTERTLLSFVGGFNVSPTGVVRLTLTPNTTQAPIKTQLGESAYLAGGNLATYDGVQMTEHPFLLFPEGINVEVVAGGGAMTAGVHQVVCIYEWIDHAGQRHQSAPSLPVSATVAANDRLRVRVPTLHVGQEAGTDGGIIYNCTIVAYITQAAGLSFNRVASTAAGAAGTTNDPTVASVTLPLIDQADTVYAANELLYNQPNLAATALPNLSPSPCNGVCVHGNRVFLDQADYPFTYAFSQVYANNVGLQFNPALTGSWPAEGGDFRAFAELDEKVVLLCSEKLYVIYGTGPNSAGSFSNYSEPQEIPSDVGCSDARSVLRMPQGIIFKSTKGFYLLGRDLQVQYIGDGVAEFDAYSITSAVLLKDRQECRFTTSSTTQPVLVYSYLDGGQWSTSSFLDEAYLMRDAVWWPLQAQYVAIDSTYGVQTDWANKYDSFSGTPRAIVWTARTSFLHLAEIGDFQRARWLLLTGYAGAENPMGGNSPQSDLGVSVYLNDVYQAAAYSFTVDFNTISFPYPLDTVDLRHKIQQQKFKSIAFQFVDTPSTSDAQSGFQLDAIQALTLQVGLRRGTMKLPAAQGVS